MPPTFAADDLHPLRFLRTFPAAAEIIRQAVHTHPNGRLSFQAVCAIHDALGPIYNDALERLPFEARPATGSMVFGPVASTIVHLARFTGQGRQIFMLAPSVVQLLAMTDLAAVRTSDLRLPYQAFYLAFDAGCELALEGPPNRIDGVYVDRFEGADGTDRLQLFLTTRRLDGPHRGAARWITGHAPHMFLALDLARDETLEAALDHVIETGELPLVVDPAKIERLENRTADFGAAFGVNVRRVEMTGHDREVAANRAAMPAVRKILALVGNALCLLTAEPDATHVAWPADTPPSLVDATRNAKTPKAKRASTSKLREAGFLPVRMLDLGDEPRAGRDVIGRGEHEVATHWRRGHWRRQRHGPGLQGVRLTWIRPTLVRGDRDGETPGRVYVVHGTCEPGSG